METIVPSAIAGHVRLLRQFLTQREIDAATERYKKELKSADIVKRMKMRELSPWIESFQAYDGVTLRGQRIPRRYPVSTQSLAIAGLKIPKITSTMSDAVKAHHRSNLLNNNHAAFFAEWSAAYFYARQHNARIDWHEPGTAGPDFIVTTKACSFEVECKRHGSMIVELFGDSEADVLASSFLALLNRRSFHGALRIRVHTHPNVDAAAALDTLERLLQTSEISLNISILNEHVEISGELSRNGGATDQATLEQARGKPFDARAYWTGEPVNGKPANFRLVLIQGPRRTPEQFANDLFERLSEIASTQLSGNRAGVLISEFARVGDANVFQENTAVAHLLDRLFIAHPHVAAVIFRAAVQSQQFDDHATIDQFAYVQRNAACTFPEAAAMRHIGNESADVQAVPA
jgi:hypothetical protein